MLLVYHFAPTINRLDLASRTSNPIWHMYSYLLALENLNWLLFVCKFVLFHSVVKPIITYTTAPKYSSEFTQKILDAKEAFKSQVLTWVVGRSNLFGHSCAHIACTTEIQEENEKKEFKISVMMRQNTWYSTNLIHVRKKKWFPDSY